MKTVKILNRWTGEVIKEVETEKGNLSSADLSSADLRSADLRFADLSSANLSSAKIKTSQKEKIIESLCLVVEE